MNAIELLKADHDTVDRLFQKVKATEEGEHKELFLKIKAELDVHAHIEEKIFYPAIKDAAATRAITLEGYEEHHVVKILLGELAAMPVDTEQWTAKLKVLKENVEHHVEEEEDEMFVSARKVLSKEEIEELGARMEAEKKNQLSKAAGKS